jgi:hypothetical protein
LVKILKFFDMHPGSRTWDGKNSNLGSGIQDGKIWIQYPGSGMGNIWIRDSGSGIKIPDQQNWVNFIAKFART